jgi:hypothetical protein
VVLKWVSDSKWILSRLSGYYWVSDKNSTDDTESRLYWYCYQSMVQFDVYSTTHTELNSIVSFIMWRLKMEEPEGRPLQIWKIPLLDFSDITSEWTETDLAINYKFWTDVSSHEISTFDPELLQVSISVNFWVDYLKEKTYPKISNINTNVTP